MRTAILVFDQFTDIDVFLPWDLLNRVKHYVPDFTVELIGTARQHTSAAGLTIPMTGQIAELSQVDAVLVASGPGIQRLLKDSDYLDRLKMMLDPERQLIGSMCSGSILLAALGLLEGRRATSYSTRLKQLASFGVEVVDQPFVSSGNVATAAGCLAAPDLVGWLVTLLCSDKVAQQVLNEIKPNGE